MKGVKLGGLMKGGWDLWGRSGKKGGSSGEMGKPGEGLEKG